MKTCIICFSDAGAALSLSLCEKLDIPREDVHSIEKFASKYGFTPHKKVCDDMGELFSTHDALIFICACGIAVRDVAPHIKNKTVDPAVVVMDDLGRFVIPLLSGHIGGANELAVRIAELINATPVVTTATDGRGRFACDSWAKTHGCAISSMKVAKDVSAAILTKDIPVCSDFALPEKLPAGLERGDSGELGIYIGVHGLSPFASTLRLVPKTVCLGIGCRKDTPEESVREAVSAALAENGIDPLSVASASSIDIKKDEQGLLAYAESAGLPISFFTAEELGRAESDVPFAHSDFVFKTVGVGNVCERAAALASGGGKLIIRKTACGGVTVAASIKEWSVVF